MPRNDDATRRTARERSRARMGRGDGSASRSSTDSYGRARQESDHLSQSRYERQAPQQTSQSSRNVEKSSRRARQSRSGRPAPDEQTRRSDRRSKRSRSDTPDRGSRSARSDSRSDSREGQRNRSRSGRAAQEGRRAPSRPDERRSSKSKSGASASASKLPSFIVPLGIGVICVIALLALVFGLLVPSCSSSGESSSSSAPSDSSAFASSASAQQGLVYQVGQAARTTENSVQTANQVGALETSNTTVQALVTLLGEEETAKLLAQAKTNPDALWIAAHPDAYAFEGIEVQYKILKLAADEPEAISYVREFPAKYPTIEAVTDKDLAMDVASPVSSVPNTSVPHLYQWDRRWAYTIYSSASFGLTGCGPTSLAMVYQGLNRTVDRTPYDMAVLAEERGYMSEFNGTDGTFFFEIASELGLNCWDAYPDATNIRDELKQGHVIIANLGPGYFTTNGHFFVLAGLTDDGQVIVNDPYSVVRSSQTWDPEFIANETMAMYVYSKA